jgi:dipeptidyl aminopeptidase/acylaminoacyl peptidase
MKLGRTDGTVQCDYRMTRYKANCSVRLALSIVLVSCEMGSSFPANASQLSTPDIPARAVTIEDVVNAPDTVPANDGGVDDLSWIGASDSVVYAYTESAGAHTQIETLDIRRQITRPVAEGCRPKPSPDGTRIAFVSTGDNGRPQLWVFELTTGRSHQLTHFTDGLFSGWSNNYEFAWSPDNSQILFAHHVGSHIGAARGSDYLERFEPGVATALIYDGKHQLYKDTQVTEIWLIDSRSGASRLVLTEPAEMVAGISWFPDGRRAAYFSQGLSEAEALTNSISILDTVSGVAQVIKSGVGQDAIPHISPDGRYIAFDRDTLGIAYPEYDVASVVRVDTGMENKLPIAGAASRVLAWAPRSDGLYVRERDDTSGDWQVEYCDFQGRKELLPALNQQKRIALSYSQRKAAWADGDTARPLLHVMRLPIARNEIWHMNIAMRANNTTRVSKGRNALLQGERGSLHWNSRDGTAMSGFLERPVDYSPGQRYPTLVMVHGGPFGGRGEMAAMPLHSPLVFDYWAAKGYVVFAPNYRSDGSAGWNAIEQAKARGDLFDRDFDDIMTGVDELIRLGIADANRLGILGHSYGSTETNWVITHTHRFRVAVSYEGEADMVWGLGGRANEYDEWLYGGSPLEKRPAYDRQSAIRNASGTTTPTLFIAGEFGIAHDQLAWMYAALTRQKTPSEFLLYRNEGHNMTAIANRKDVMQRVNDWIENHID